MEVEKIRVVDEGRGKRDEGRIEVITDREKVKGKRQKDKGYGY